MVYRYLDLLKDAKEYERMIHVCRLSLDVDVFDERLHLALMNALIRTNRNNEALLSVQARDQPAPALSGDAAARRPSRSSTKQDHQGREDPGPGHRPRSARS